jgi:hypothetical protein
MPVRPSSTPSASSTADLQREIAALRTDIDKLRKQRADGISPAPAGFRLTTAIAAFALLLSLIGLLRH